jgi:hypothetical protein
MITVHCGLHKTGSSSIQLALELSSGKGRTIVTPKPGDDRSETGWRDRLARLAKSPNAVFSDEGLLGSPYDGYRLAPARVAMLREALTGSRYQVVVYLRPHVGWLPSVYLQGVQEGRTIGPEEFWASIKDEPYLRWANLLDLLQRESGAEKVVPRAHTRSRDAVADFFDVVGLGKPPRTGKIAIRENVSIGAAQAVLLRELSARDGVDDAQRHRFRSVFQQDLAAGKMRHLSPFPVVTQDVIADTFMGDWTSIASRNLPDDESSVFQLAISQFRAGTAPFAGRSLVDPYVGEEALRSIQALVLNQRSEERPTLVRVVDKFRHDPWGVPHAALRRFRRQSS